MIEIRGPMKAPRDYAPVVAGGAVVTVLALLLATIAAWITHVIVCIKAASWWLLLFGILAPPVGIVHGVGVWLGVF